MTNEELIAKIKAEIERRYKEFDGKTGDIATTSRPAYLDVISFLSTLEESERPEPYNPVYDEAYLNEKIKKATEWWKGVDVDAMLAECRGYDEEKSEKPMNQDELEKAVVDYFEGYWPGMETAEQCNTDLRFTPPAIMRLARHFAEWQKEQMLKEAVEGIVTTRSMAGNIVTAHVDYRYKDGQKVRVIVIPNTDEK